jgi:hypothetical protein
VRLVICLLLFSATTLGADVTGKWSGSTFSRDRLWPWEVSFSTEGASQPLFVILRQRGDIVEGSAGPDEIRQYPLHNGMIQGDEVRFEVAFDASGPVAQFHLVMSGDQLHGGVSTQGVDLSSVKVSLNRLPPGFSQDTHTLLKDGATALFEEDYAAANKYFERALAKEPSFADAYLYLGASYYRQGLGNDPLHPDLMLLKKAAFRFQQVLRLDTGNPQIRMYLGSILCYRAEAEPSVEARTREFEEAKATYRKVAGLDARNFDALYMIAAIDRREMHEYLIAARGQLGMRDTNGPLPDGKARRDVHARIEPLYEDAINSLARAARLRPDDDELVKSRYACMREKAQLAASEEQYHYAMDEATRWLQKAQEEARFARNKPLTAEQEAEMRRQRESPEVIPPPGYVLPSLDAQEDDARQQ